jgi:hypothetical protein
MSRPDCTYFAKSACGNVWSGLKHIEPVGNPQNADKIEACSSNSPRTFSFCVEVLAASQSILMRVYETLSPCIEFSW